MMLKKYNTWPGKGGWMDQTEYFLKCLPELEKQFGEFMKKRKGKD